MNTESIIKTILGQTLSLGERGSHLMTDSPLIGALPELDSMSIVAVLTDIEEQFGLLIPDDEIAADHFATLGSLARWVEHLQSQA